MTLKEIFKDNLDLLENESVKKLIQYDTESYERLYRIATKHRLISDYVLDILMKSEVIVKDGVPARQTVEEIFKLYEEE